MKVRWFAVATLAMFASGPRIAAQSDPPADAAAGTWQMIVLSSPSQIAVPAPGNTAGPDYQAELTAIRNAQTRLTRAERKAMEYWSAGGVLRWNEFMLELVSRANLPPAPAPAGTYPVPDANNPFADPVFPFGNPPYAARAYSYVAVAQYEALKAAWYYKFLYNRLGPARLDTRIQSLMPATGVPSYPSEDAVVSGVTAELLKLLFPTAVEQITLKAGEQRRAALVSGRASASDIAAGLALGQAVAAVFVARAGADGMRTAGGSPALVQALAAAAAAHGEVPWQSRETPPRPPMLAAFGSVRAWMMTSDDVVRERPGPPPSTSSALMARELAEVKDAVEGISLEELAIAYKWADGVSTPTPPGHWNYLAWPYITQTRISEVRAARVLAFLNMAMHDAAVVTWDTKMFYYNPRPSQLDPSIRTVIGLPNFPSYISGHSTFSAAAAEVLSYVFPSGRDFFHAQKDEAGISRLYAGIHYPSDIEIGKSVGARVGWYAVRFARLDAAER